MIHLFIDTNAFLNFYHYSDEDLDRLSDLKSFISETSEIKLYVSSQLVDEFKRNRETKIQDSLKQFTAAEVKNSIPVICSGYEETARFRQLMAELADCKKTLLSKVKTDVESQTLKADKVIRILFRRAIAVDEDIIRVAVHRFDMGRPPGKNKSYGDAINWEFLLEHVPEGEDLHFISSDRDYTSPLDENKFSLYLREEWEQKKLSKIHYYRSLRSFFKVKYPNVEILGDEYIKDSKIRNFETSSTFDEARLYLKKLASIDGLSDVQLNRIIKAAVTNSQIFNAHTYSPDLIGLPLYTMIQGRHGDIDPELLERFHGTFELPDEDDF